MPRAGQVKPPVVERLSDRMAIGVLTSTFPPELVDRVVAEAGRAEQRQRLLPARVVVWLVLAMALFGGQSYEEVARLLAGGLGWALGPAVAAVVWGAVDAGDRQGQGTAWRRAAAAAVCRGRPAVGDP